MPPVYWALFYWGDFNTASNRARFVRFPGIEFSYFQRYPRSIRHWPVREVTRAIKIWLSTPQRYCRGLWRNKVKIQGFLTPCKAKIKGHSRTEYKVGKEELSCKRYISPHLTDFSPSSLLHFQNLPPNFNERCHHISKFSIVICMVL